MSLGTVREAYLKRALRRLQTGATSVGFEQVLGSWASDARFRLAPRQRADALSTLAACNDEHDYFRFTADHLPGALFFPPGSSQNEDEILAMLALAAERGPRTVVEIGTQAGGTTFLLGTLLPSVSLLIGIDLFVRNKSRLRSFARAGLDLRFINADSSLASTYAAVEQALAGRTIDLLFIDGDHSFRGALHDLRTYRTLVTPGGLVVFHDIVPDSTLRLGSESLAWAGEVTVLWELLRGQYASHEFVDSWRQDGRGIGVLEYDPQVAPQLVPARALATRIDGRS